MPDISMCVGTGCERADECYRHTATPNPVRQSYFGPPPFDEYGECRYFISNEQYGAPDEADRS